MLHTPPHHVPKKQRDSSSNSKEKEAFHNTTLWPKMQANQLQMTEMIGTGTMAQRQRSGTDAGPRERTETVTTKSPANVETNGAAAVAWTALCAPDTGVN